LTVEEAVMTDDLVAAKTISINRPLLAGGVGLLAAGAVLCLAGGVATTVAVIGATRTWVGQWEESPAAKARRRYAQARSAAVAGANVWKQNSRGHVDTSMAGASGL
jgi:hypothetical protein